MDLKDRLAEFLQVVNLNQKELAALTGYSEQSMSKFFTGGTKNLKTDLISSIANHYPKLNLHWLLLGEGEMWLSETERQLQRMDIQQLIKKSEALQEEVEELREKTAYLQDLVQSKDEIIRLLKERKG